MSTQREIGGPDFVGVGTQRSGTTWWFETLLEHPDIVLPRSGKKELHYFERFCLREMSEADVEHYRTRFAAPPGKISGEWTPRYMHDFWTPQLLKRAAPRAKLLVLFRDPVDRFRSGLPHRLQMAEVPEVQRIIVEQIDRGRYATQLARLLDHFERDRVLCLQYERCVADPATHYERTLRFLGVDPDFVPEDFTKARGVSHEASKEPLWPDFEAGMVSALQDEVASLCELLPDLDLSLWSNFRHLANLHAGDRPRT